MARPTLTPAALGPFVPSPAGQGRFLGKALAPAISEARFPDGFKSHHTPAPTNPEDCSSLRVIR